MQVLPPRACDWCEGPLPEDARSDAIYCRQLCRQTAFRLRRRRTTSAGARAPARFAYADPPYPRRAYRYKGEASYAGEVDHAALVARLEAGAYLGWALSTSRDALREVLTLCPREATALPWCKPLPVPRAGVGLQTRTEYLIVVRGRQIPPGVRDFLYGSVAHGGGTLTGRKPLAFCAWLFDALGMRAGDTLDDLFPGTGIVSRAWRHASASRRDVVDDASAASVEQLAATGSASPGQALPEDLVIPRRRARAS